MSNPSPARIAEMRHRLKREILSALEARYEGPEVGGLEIDWHFEELYVTIHGADVVFRIEPEFYTTLD